MTTSAELRQTFLNFFKDKGHEIVPSSPLVPANDPTLLFTNAGMVQFKDVFLGQDQRPYKRATTSQRCVRAGGKHNDLENVGYTARHHTFFEMLGNFSFGDYFKREAIHYAWELLVDVLGLPPDKLWVTVYQTDEDAHQIWTQEIGIPLDRITRIGDKPGGGSDNFWQMGDTGPCGPCTEVFYDHGPDVAGGPPGSPDEDGDRYIEIWNLVFMQFDRAADGTLTPLPKPSVDTGMGLERLAAVMQGVHSNYDIDLFQNLLRAAAAITGCQDLHNNSLKVLADHIRSTAFLITDGVLPSNEGRGYVLRRIMRRAIRHGYKLGAKDSFFYQLVAPLVAEMGDAYPELRQAQDQVTRVIEQEEERFAETLDNGMGLLERDIAALHGKTIPGATVFKLYDTYGFPVDLTADIARERGLDVDMTGFNAEMDAQRERARAASQFGTQQAANLAVEGSSEFSGYDTVQDQSTVTGLFRAGQAVEQLDAGDEGMVVLTQTPFYAESGGQVGDSGVLRSAQAEFTVQDTQKQGAVHLHIGRIEHGSLRLGDKIEALVDADRRQAIVLNHSATHLLHAALRQVLGTHVQQKGSLVAPDRLRFDFSHHAPLTAEELQRIETLVNQAIRRNEAADVRQMSYDDALKFGAIALFGEKYGDQVRVMKFGDFSTELCGGTHVNRTGDIGLFKIISETGIASGVRRIEALTGANALNHVRTVEQRLDQIAQLVKGSPDNANEKVRQLSARARELEKEIVQLKQRLASGQSNDLSTQAVDIKGIKVLAARLDAVDVKTLRSAVDQFRDKLQHAAVLLATVDGDTVRLVAGVTKAETSRIKAGDLVNVVAQQIGARGGGRPDLAQAGGGDPAKLDAALQAVPDWVKTQLAK
ncbi:MAG: alanine--tRNA ligase [Gammaproteobacteria bacterium]